MAVRYYTDITKHRYPGIARAALEMAYDNGGVNRFRPESATIEELDIILAHDTYATLDLSTISEWLSGLSYDELVIAVAGEETETAELMAAAPVGTIELLNAIFDGPE